MFFSATFSLSSSGFSPPKTPFIFHIQYLPTTETTAEWCKERDAGGGYFNDMTDESEPIYMMMGRNGMEEALLELRVFRFGWTDV